MDYNGIKHPGAKVIPSKLHLQHLFQTEGRCVSTGRQKVSAQTKGICTHVCALTIKRGPLRPTPSVTVTVTERGNELHS